MNIVQYTAIFGGYDDIQPVEQYIDAPNVEYVCFTDNPQDVAGWKMRKVRSYTGNPILESRRYKAQPHKYLPDADITIWHGGSTTLHASALEAAAWLPVGAHMAVLAHPHRDCVYKEAEAVILLGKEKEAVVDRVVEFLRSERYPEHNGLAAAALLIRRNTPEVQEFNALWWEVIKEYTTRDQLTFDYCCWKMGLKAAVIPGNLTGSDNWTWRPHG